MQQTVRPLSITGLIVWLLLLGAGCAGVRPARPPAELLAQREAHDVQMAATARAFRDRIMARLKARYDTQPGVPVVYDLLVLSGGGDWAPSGPASSKAGRGCRGHSPCQNLTWSRA